MATFLEGDEDVLSIYQSTAYVPIGCLTSNGLSESVNMRETQTKCDPGETVVRPGTSSSTLNFEGIASADGGILSYAGLKTIHRAKTLITWRNGKAGSYEYGTGYIESLEKTAPAGDDITFTGSIRVNGAISSTDPEAEA